MWGEKKGSMMLDGNLQDGYDWFKAILVNLTHARQHSRNIKLDITLSKIATNFVSSKSLHLFFHPEYVC